MSHYSPFVLNKVEARQMVQNQAQSGNENRKCYMLQVSQNELLIEKQQ